MHTIYSKSMETISAAKGPIKSMLANLADFSSFTKQNPKIT